jgi:hypothetical protein
MAMYDSEADPYTYVLVSQWRAGGPRRYEVYRDGELLGQIEGGTRSTDAQIVGTRLRRPGKGAPAFYEVGDRYRVPYDRRRDAAACLERNR